MRLVHHQQANARRDGLQHRLHKLRVAQPLGRDQQRVHTTCDQFIADAAPVLAILFLRGDPHGADARAFCGGDLIPHQREQRRNDERRPGVLFA